MSTELTIIITLIVYKLILIAVGLWASKKTHTEKDFFLASGSLGPWVSALSASASSSSAWTLLGVSGAAYQWGFAAIWLFPAVLGGFIFNWFWLAPRLFKRSKEGGMLTLTEVLADDVNKKVKNQLTVICSLIVLICFVFYVASQFDAAGETFVTTFGANRELSIIVGAVIIVFYTLLGGFLAVSVTDSIQGFMMMLAAIVLPVVAVSELLHQQGVEVIFSAINSEHFSITPGYGGAMAVAFIIGTLGIGLGYPGQPHVVNRFMALRDESALKMARKIAISWAVIIYSGMIVLGWCGRILVETSSNQEQILMVLANDLLHPMLAGVLLASVLSAIMSTADSMLLAAGAAVSYDLGKVFWPNKSNHQTLLRSRITIAVISMLAVLMAIYVEQSIYSRVLFAWSAIGAAFGPLLIFRLSNRDIVGQAAVVSVLMGFVATLFFYWQKNTPGDYLERLAPFMLSFIILAVGSKRTKN